MTKIISLKFIVIATARFNIIFNFSLYNCCLLFGRDSGRDRPWELKKLRMCTKLKMNRNKINLRRVYAFATQLCIRTCVFANNWFAFDSHLLSIEHARFNDCGEMFLLLLYTVQHAFLKIDKWCDHRHFSQKEKNNNNHTNQCLISFFQQELFKFYLLTNDRPNLT